MSVWGWKKFRKDKRIIMKNTIQVYGLPRSGTNFLEWTLMEYFKNFNYKNFYKKCDVKHLNIYNKKVATKHSYPSFEFSDKIIVIYKDYDKWNKSYRKWSNNNGSMEIWKNYLNKSKELNSDNCIIISHDELYNNYKNNIILFSKKFNLVLKDKPIIKPDGYFNKGGAESKPNKNKKYKHE